MEYEWLHFEVCHSALLDRGSVYLQIFKCFYFVHTLVFEEVFLTVCSPMLCI